MVYHVPRVSEAEAQKHPGVSKDALIVTKSRAISKQLATQIEKRLKAASVKDFHVTAENFEVKVSIGGKDADDPRITALLKGPGYVEIRPILDEGGRRWENYQTLLPPDMRVLGLAPKSYLWAPNLDKLQEVLNTASMLSATTISQNGKPAENRLVAGPNDLTTKEEVGKNEAVSGGWRSYFLGPLLLSNDGINKSSWVMDGNGGYSTILALKSSVALPKNISKSIAILVDNKLVAILPIEKVGNQVRLTPPATLPKSEQRIWARAMAGSFAAPISIPYGIANIPAQTE